MKKIKGYIFLSKGEQPFFLLKKPTKRELKLCNDFYTKTYYCEILLKGRIDSLPTKHLKPIKQGFGQKKVNLKKIKKNMKFTETEFLKKLIELLTYGNYPEKINDIILFIQGRIDSLDE